MLESVILHIGAEKTGTTSIQGFLSSNRDKLAQCGYLFPASVGNRNHMDLAFASLPDDSVKLRKRLTQKSKLNNSVEFRGLIRNGLLSEINAYVNRRPIHTLILSAEHLHSQLTTKADVARLVSMLPQHKQVKVILYIRRQDQLALSLHSTFLKTGTPYKHDYFVFPDYAGKSIPWKYDYYSAYALWAGYFSHEQVRVRLYEKDSWDSGCLIRDFCCAAQLPWSLDYSIPRTLNQRLDNDGVYLFNRLSALIAESKGHRSMVGYKKLHGIISDVFVSGETYRPDKESAIQFMSNFKVINDSLRRNVFSERETLFSESFDEYPDKFVSPEPDLARIVDKLLLSLIE